MSRERVKRILQLGFWGKAGKYFNQAVSSGLRR
jgi:hypothetical protein